MSIAYLLVVLGLALLGGAVWALFWAVDSGQFDDLEAHGRSILDAAGEEEAAPGPPLPAAPASHHIAIANSASSSTTKPATASNA